MAELLCLADLEQQLGLLDMRLALHLLHLLTLLLLDLLLLDLLLSIQLIPRRDPRLQNLIILP